MATYISLINFTDQGIRNVKHTPERAKAATQAAEKLGIKVKVSTGRWGSMTPCSSRMPLTTRQSLPGL